MRDRGRKAPLAPVTTQTTERFGEAPTSRLLLAHDNLDALAALLDEREPGTDEPRYRGKVTLVYVDPPFMAQADFSARARTAPGTHAWQARDQGALVDVVAYRDVWRGGIDAYLAMLRPRLALLRDLLADHGSIFVHLDWRAVHYVKVLMDELFGYDCFQTDIVWRYRRWPAKAHNLQRMHDTILYYRKSAARPPTFHTLYEPLAPSTQKTFGARRQRADFSSGHRKPSLDEEPSPGAPLSDVWDIGLIAPLSPERTGYPTQKPLSLLERVVAIASSPGDIVLDAFAGSGTTLEASARAGRRFVGIDSSPIALQLARTRLARLSATAPFTVEHVAPGPRPRPDREASLLERLGAHRDRSLSPFAGARGDALVHIGPEAAPLTPARLGQLAREAKRQGAKALIAVSARPLVLFANRLTALSARLGISIELRLDHGEAPSPPPLVLCPRVEATLDGDTLTVSLVACPHDPLQLAAPPPLAGLVESWALDPAHPGDEAAPLSVIHSAARTRKHAAALTLRHRYPDRGPRVIAVRVSDVTGNEGHEALRVDPR